MPQTLVSKTIKLTIPSNGSVMVYDTQGQLVENTYLSQKDTVTLPEGGFVGFAGDIGTTFSYKLQ